MAFAARFMATLFAGTLALPRRTVDAPVQRFESRPQHFYLTLVRDLLPLDVLEIFHDQVQIIQHILQIDDNSIDFVDRRVNGSAFWGGRGR